MRGKFGCVCWVYVFLSLPGKHYSILVNILICQIDCDIVSITWHFCVLSCTTYLTLYYWNGRPHRLLLRKFYWHQFILDGSEFSCWAFIFFNSIDPHVIAAIMPEVISGPWCTLSIPVYRPITCFQEKFWPLRWSIKYKIHATKIIPLETYFEYEPSGIVFVPYISSILTKLMVIFFLK
jgi:hypothetical protein